MNYATNFGSISLNKNILYILYCLNRNILYILYYLSYVIGKLTEQNIIGSYFLKIVLSDYQNKNAQLFSGLFIFMPAKMLILLIIKQLLSLTDKVFTLFLCS